MKIFSNLKKKRKKLRSVLRKFFFLQQKKGKRNFEHFQEIEISVSTENLENTAMKSSIQEVYLVTLYRIMRSVSDDDCKNFFIKRKDMALIGYKSSAVMNEVYKKLPKKATLIACSTVMFDHFIDHGYGPGDYLMVVTA